MGCEVVWFSFLPHFAITLPCLLCKHTRVSVALEMPIDALADLSYLSSRIYRNIGTSE